MEKDKETKESKWTGRKIVLTWAVLFIGSVFWWFKGQTFGEYTFFALTLAGLYKTSNQIEKNGKLYFKNKNKEA